MEILLPVENSNRTYNGIILLKPALQNAAGLAYELVPPTLQFMTAPKLPETRLQSGLRIRMLPPMLHSSVKSTRNQYRFIFA